MELSIDLVWILQRQALVMPKEPDVHDCSALAAAVQRHTVNTPRISYEPGNAWRAAALLAVEYMATSGEGVEVLYGLLPDLVAKVRAYDVDVYSCADQLRAWRV